MIKYKKGIGDMEKNVKLFDLETKEKFTKELKKSIFENRVDISYIVKILNKYNVDLVSELEHYDEKKDSIFEKEIFSFERHENVEEKLEIVLNNNINTINIETGDINKIIKILEEFIRACEIGYEENKERKKVLSDFFEDME